MCGCELGSCEARLLCLSSVVWEPQQFIQTQALGVSEVTVSLSVLSALSLRGLQEKIPAPSGFYRVEEFESNAAQRKRP